MADGAAAKTVDKEALRAKYAAERAKRLRPEGNEQYLEITGKLSRFQDDPYVPRQERAPVKDHVTFAFIGAGFAGLLAGARVKEAGISDVRLIEKGGGVGGTWYWNRYPGAQCDTASMIYLPLLEETGHRPSEKYAHGPEIRGQCERIAEQFKLKDNALFHTKVTGLEWQEKDKRWRITTDRGDDFTAQFVGIGTGPLHVPKLPGIPGIESFKGHSFHTSRWDYAYTGGDGDGAPMTKLKDKRVGIIGTGATSVQAVPHLSRAAGELYVFQRTPSSIDARHNQPIDPDWFKTIAEPGWQLKWLENFTENQGLGMPKEDLVQDGWTDISRRIRQKIMTLASSDFTMEKMLAAYEDSDFEKMEEIRARVDQVVKDRETAQKLKAWYRQLCKRPCFHDDYLQAFNNPNTHLIDTDGKGVERITETGVVVAGVEYPLDCIIYASGFEVGTPQSRRSGFDPVGRGGQRLSEAWAHGMRSKHGVHVHGFPNMFLSQPAQGANLISNVPHNLWDAAKTIAQIVKHMTEKGLNEVDVTAQAQDQWLELLQSAPPRMIGAQDCTPGYYNNEGQEPDPAAGFFMLGYPGGAAAYFRYIEEWRKKGTFDGLAFA